MEEEQPEQLEVGEEVKVESEDDEEKAEEFSAQEEDTQDNTDDNNAEITENGNEEGENVDAEKAETNEGENVDEEKEEEEEEIVIFVSQDYEINGEVVPITIANGLEAPLQYCLESKLFTDWVATLDSAFKVESIMIQSVDLFGPRVGFMKIKANIVNRKTGAFIPGICFLRGGSVAILVVIECPDNGEKYTILTRQPRAPVGRFFSLGEIPAGMLDGSGHFSGVAAKELQEETGISIKSSDPHLVDLTAMVYGSDERGVVLSPGGCDESIRIFSYTLTLTKSEIEAMNGRLHGEAAEGETIKLEIIPLEELPERCADGKSLAALALWQKVKRLSLENARASTVLKSL
eukprot:GCRY01004269.1.p1 GENE.GCRY01004269.1~~GCRY01004269.1.p1  ORF type:complete len:379 (-),score=98.36 GCRY01004269.1:152-1195(-)